MKSKGMPMLNRAVACSILIIAIAVVSHATPGAVSPETGVSWAARPLPGHGSKPFAVAQADDGGFFIAGQKYDFDLECGPHGSCRTDIFIAKLDAEGKLLWRFSYGGMLDDKCTTIATAAGGGMVAACAKQQEAPTPGDDRTLYLDILIIKVDAAGGVVWMKTFNNGMHFNLALGIYRAPGGGYVITGASKESEEGRLDPWIFRLDENGNCNHCF